MLLDTGRISWGPRRTARVRITAQITDTWVGPVDVSLDVPRGCFRTDESVRGVLARLLAGLMAAVTARPRAARREVRVTCRVRPAGRPWARLRMPAATFNVFRQHYPDGASPACVRAMARLWFHQCIGERGADLIRRPPRAGGVTRRLLITCL